MPAVFGDFLAAAAEHLEAAVVVGDAGGVPQPLLELVCLFHGHAPALAGPQPPPGRYLGNAATTRCSCEQTAATACGPYVNN